MARHVSDAHIDRPLFASEQLPAVTSAPRSLSVRNVTCFNRSRRTQLGPNVLSAFESTRRPTRN